MAEGDIMKFYSEITKDLYDTKEELVKAEVEATKEQMDELRKNGEVTIDGHVYKKGD